jgi:diguanylate cyclase (GGDEF)-like protein/PAS domain S-box-containing protein
MSTQHLRHLAQITALTLGLAVLYSLPAQATAPTLSDSERLYVHSHTPTLCVDPVWEPFEVIDSAGKHVGIAADLHALVRERVGLSVQLYPARTWQESLDASKNGGCQLLSFVNSSPARDQWLIFTAPLLIDPNVLITREEHPTITDLASLKGEKIALPLGTAMYERVSQAFPNLTVVGVVDEEDALGLVSNKTVDMTLRSRIIAAHTIKKEGWFNLKLNSALPGYENQLRIGVVKSEPQLRDILDKGIATLTEQDRARIVDHHVQIKLVTDVQVDYTLVKWLAVLIAAIVVTSLFWLRRLKRALAKISRSEERHRVIFQTSASAGIVWREGFIVTDWNRKAELVFGWTREEVLGRSFVDFLIPVAHRPRLVAEMLPMRQEDVLPSIINDCLTRDGRTITCEWFNAWLPSLSGEPREIVSLTIDITERQQLEAQIRQLAFFDPLTQLPNRRLLQERLERVFAAAQRHGTHAALFFVDLDNFKPLNDTHGHEMGDLLLIEVAQRLKACVHDTDTVARFGGDEFVVLLGQLDSDAVQACAQAEHIAHNVLDRLAQPYRLLRSNGTDSIEHRCSASIGVVVFNGAANEASVFRRADHAMYRAKTNGRNGIVVDAAAHAPSLT